MALGRVRWVPREGTQPQEGAGGSWAARGSAGAAVPALRGAAPRQLQGGRGRTSPCPV